MRSMFGGEIRVLEMVRESVLNVVKVLRVFEEGRFIKLEEVGVSGRVDKEVMWERWNLLIGNMKRVRRC